MRLLHYLKLKIHKLEQIAEKNDLVLWDRSTRSSDLASLTSLFYSFLSPDSPSLHLGALLDLNLVSLWGFLGIFTGLQCNFEKRLCMCFWLQSGVTFWWFLCRFTVHTCTNTRTRMHTHTHLFIYCSLRWRKEIEADVSLTTVIVKMEPLGRNKLHLYTVCVCVCISAVNMNTQTQIPETLRPIAPPNTAHMHSKHIHAHSAATLFFKYM